MEDLLCCLGQTWRGISPDKDLPSSGAPGQVVGSYVVWRLGGKGDGSKHRSPYHPLCEHFTDGFVLVSRAPRVDGTDEKEVEGKGDHLQNALQARIGWPLYLEGDHNSQVLQCGHRAQGATLVRGTSKHTHPHHAHKDTPDHSEFDTAIREDALTPMSMGESQQVVMAMLQDSSTQGGGGGEPYVVGAPVLFYVAREGGGRWQTLYWGIGNRGGAGGEEGQLFDETYAFASLGSAGETVTAPLDGLLPPMPAFQGPVSVIARFDLSSKMLELGPPMSPRASLDSYRLCGGPFICLQLFWTVTGGGGGGGVAPSALLPSLLPPAPPPMDTDAVIILKAGFEEGGYLKGHVDELLVVGELLQSMMVLESYGADEEAAFQSIDKCLHVKDQGLSSRVGGVDSEEGLEDFASVATGTDLTAEDFTAADPTTDLKWCRKMELCNYVKAFLSQEQGHLTAMDAAASRLDSITRAAPREPHTPSPAERAPVGVGHKNGAHPPPTSLYATLRSGWTTSEGRDFIERLWLFLKRGYNLADVQEALRAILNEIDQRARLPTPTPTPTPTPPGASQWQGGGRVRRLSKSGGSGGAGGGVCERPLLPHVRRDNPTKMARMIETAVRIYQLAHYGTVAAGQEISTLQKQWQDQRAALEDPRHVALVMAEMGLDSVRRALTQIVLKTDPSAQSDINWYVDASQGLDQQVHRLRKFLHIAELCVLGVMAKLPWEALRHLVKKATLYYRTSTEGSLPHFAVGLSRLATATWIATPPDILAAPAMPSASSSSAASCVCGDGVRGSGRPLKMPTQVRVKGTLNTGVSLDVTAAQVPYNPMAVAPRGVVQLVTKPSPPAAATATAAAAASSVEESEGVSDIQWGAGRPGGGGESLSVSMCIKRAAGAL
ncbi:unnamed protein product [Vitrella brassicaformis CCMP3155]|uniref:Uncharacterized protein n=2 Tax=Vitrella brassicaformis TaxID=1169539 RepID=A0A0G4F5B8_VITBC|nr:unnamed protein product [Vitrella brassicaformis CCMP3155]|eukprot:CEM07040.1 unnamed protein product [Vitrella brassicaformis CCMP3155]